MKSAYLRNMQFCKLRVIYFQNMQFCKVIGKKMSGFVTIISQLILSILKIWSLNTNIFIASMCSSSSPLTLYVISLNCDSLVLITHCDEYPCVYE
jgi:hypothetical protein